MEKYREDFWNDKGDRKIEIWKSALSATRFNHFMMGIIAASVFWGILMYLVK